MFRKKYGIRPHKSTKCMQYVVLVASPQYLNAYLEDIKPTTPLLEGLIDDILTAKFGIIKQKKKKFTDEEVADWFCERSASDDCAQYTNGTSLLMLLCRQNAINVGQELAKFHNKLSLIKLGKPAIHVSYDVVEAQRDMRMLFPEISETNTTDLASTRSYVISHLARPLIRELASLTVQQNKKIIHEKKNRLAFLNYS